ncbi:DUF982 domain-containing protein [Phyllobacterium endophyticum]|uniref:DUF982 domain-containing protein n=2 Tax=Phyllobacterium endophyticum TaxID=1149773 RepID=A0A2P7AVH3_9HYPH|nr:DUF982 domain-containing protein [Phyllobacterium endophyticum]TYR38897.1 DUF982 domain-containing protein [Phyllobacterium endophyticum]
MYSMSTETIAAIDPASPDTRKNLPFPHVTVMTDEAGNTKKVESVGEAALWLIERWPGQGEKFKLAKQACLDALDGKITCTECRDAFIEAVKEAGIYVEEKRL